MIKMNKKLRYREEHSASVVLIVGVLYDDDDDDDDCRFVKRIRLYCATCSGAL